MHQYIEAGRLPSTSVIILYPCGNVIQTLINKNLDKNKYKIVKRHTNRVLDKKGAPAPAWFLILVYICLVLNNYVDPNLSYGTKSPLMMAFFVMNDISILLYFYFWQPVYCLLH